MSKMPLVYSGINYHFSQFFNHKKKKKKAHLGTDGFLVLPETEAKPQKHKSEGRGHGGKHLGEDSRRK